MMAQWLSSVKWYWFLSPEPLLAGVVGISGAWLLASGWYYPVWLSVWGVYAIAAGVGGFFFFKRTSAEKAGPPMWFRLFWIGVVCLEIVIGGVVFYCRN
jgi:hypothetical protein